jgi:Domain of unknown function (DUF6883)
MKLPAADRVVIDVVKLRDYLLSPSHPVGRFKASFFAALGYTATDWHQLEMDLRALVQSSDATLGQASKYGQKYEVRGMRGRVVEKNAEVVTVWIIRTAEDVPRFVTAHPAGKS